MVICVTQAARENRGSTSDSMRPRTWLRSASSSDFDAEVDVEFLVVAGDSGRGPLDGFDAGRHVVPQRFGEGVALHPYLTVGDRYDQVGARWTGQT